MLTQGGFVGTGCCSWKSEGPFLPLTLAPFSHSLFKLPSLLPLLLFPLILLLHYSKRTQFIGISLHEDWARTMWFLPLGSIYLSSWVWMAYLFLKHRSDHTYPQLSHLQWFLLPLEPLLFSLHLEISRLTSKYFSLHSPCANDSVNLLYIPYSPDVSPHSTLILFLLKMSFYLV